MKYLLISVLLFACVCKGIQAQNIIPTNIKSAVLESAIILPKQDNKALLIKELTSQEEGRPIKFAETHSTEITSKNAGVWDTSRSDFDIWRLKIESKGALSLNLGFEKIYLPMDSELFVSNADRSYTIGPFTHADNEAHGQLWTPIVKGDVIFLELNVPKTKRDELVIELSKINHDYLGFGRSFSGSCNLDVICGEADGFEMVDEYRDIIQSVGAYHINGNSTCSGVLINNTREDKRPYFLTAFHCGISENNAASVVAYWNYENSYCRQPNGIESGQDGDGNLDQFNSGAIYRAGSSASDFNLIEFEDPIKSEHKPYFAGWNNAFESTQMVIGIHHPGVEEKRISFEFDEVVDGTNNYIEVTDWDIGTTEGGSSGSPIFNTEKQIIGQLQGGAAACSNDLSDRYGSINASWLGNGTPETSLKPWLDPDDTGKTEIDGFNGAFGIQLSENNFKICNQNQDIATIDFQVESSFTDFVNLDLQNLPAGLIVNSLPTNIIPGGTGQIVLENLSSLSFGSYEFLIVSSDGENIGENQVSLAISDESPKPITAISPENLIEDVQTSHLFFWEALYNANSYEIQIAYDDSFTNLFTSVNEISEPEYQAQNLDNLSQFFWRVRAENYCGIGEWSETFSFKTLQSYCITVSSKDVPIPISENGESHNISSLFLDYPILIDNIKVPLVSIEHTYIEDLIIILSNPENSDEVQLFATSCGSNENIFAGFGDLGNENLPCPPVDGMLYKPVTRFRNIAGINAQGKWDLNVYDTYNFDGGEISSWNMEICFSKTEYQTIIPLNEEGQIVCLGQDNRLEYFYNLEGDQINDLNELSLETVDGQQIDFQYMGSFPIEGSGSIEIIVDGASSSLSEGTNELYFKLGSELEAVSIVNVQNMPFFDAIEGVNNGEILEELGTLTWIAEGADDYTVYIAQDIEFTDIVWSMSLEGGLSSIDGPDLEDGEYYLVIEARNNCGTISSELYNFIIDESVSIQESNEPTLFVRQNVVDNTLILSGNSLQNELQVSIISVSGHKLLSQYFHEESLQMDVSALIPGVYFLQIRSGLDSTIRKIVIY